MVSLSRLRSLTGKPTPAATSLDSDLLPATQRRFGSLTLGVAGALLGLSYPCDDKRCAMRERRAVSDLAVTSPPFCPEHIKQLAQTIAAPPSK